MKNVILESNEQFVRKPFEDFIACLRLIGQKNIDLSLIVPHVYVDSEEYLDVCHVKDKLRESGINVPLITTHAYRYSITAAKGTEQRKRTLGYYKNCIDFAEYIEASRLVVTGSGGIFDGNKKDLICNSIENLEELSDYAACHGVTLLIGAVLGEFSPYNVTTPVLVNLEDIRKVMGACCSSYLKVFVDTEVISIMGETLTDWFSAFGKDVEMIRLTDGNYNGYRIWGRGTLPLSKYLKEIDSHGFEGLISLQIPGEKYVNDPERALFENRKYVRDHLERIVYGSNH